MRCPRRDENPIGGPLNPIDAQDEWRPDHTCPYCGSFDPAVLLERMEAGTVELGPTDKNYKVYLDLPEEEPSAKTIRTSSSSGSTHTEGMTQLTEENIASFVGIDGRTEKQLREWPGIDGWLKVEERGPRRHAKFYFQHFSPEQAKRFTELYNEKKLKIGMPGYFYVWPYFWKPA